METDDVDDDGDACACARVTRAHRVVDAENVVVAIARRHKVQCQDICKCRRRRIFGAVSPTNVPTRARADDGWDAADASLAGLLAAMSRSFVRKAGRSSVDTFQRARGART